MIGPRTSVAERPHRVTLQRAGPDTPDGEGHFSHTWIDLAPAAVYARITPATARDLERVSAGTLLSSASHIVSMPYHPQLTTKCRVLFNGRIFNVTGVGNPDERNVETIAVCTELVS